MRRLFLLCLCVCLPLSATAQTGSDFAHHRRSRFFSFHYQSESWDAAAFARFADGFVDLVNRDFLELPYAYPIDVLVLPDHASFKQYLRERFQILDAPDFGIFIPRRKLFATFEDSGLGTFAHEIMHPLVARNMTACPVWATEAIPAFFEKFIACWDGERLSAQWGYQNPWRIDALGPELEQLDLAAILVDQRPVTGFANSERRLVTVFLWQQGKLRRFLRLVAASGRTSNEACFVAAMGMPLVAIGPLWKSYLAEIAAHRGEIMQIPASLVFPNRAGYERALSTQPPWLPAATPEASVSSARR